NEHFLLAERRRGVNVAADLGRLPTDAVAAKHGYADQSHFSRDIVRRTGARVSSRPTTDGLHRTR
uniref:hypothetical protein n=1 Tax=Escherichia coli TaxID=562 RepID=UPI003C30AC87